MNFEPQTYEELIRMKRCVELTKYYEVTEEELWEISSFPGAGAGGFHQGRQTESVPHHRAEYCNNPEGDHGELHRQQH
ncbi:MAG: hypothetical protein ACLR6I_08450 [Waltera sp.]